MGGCVAKKNYRWFIAWALMQLVTSTLYLTYVYSAVHVIWDSSTGFFNFLGVCLFHNFFMTLATIMNTGAFVFSVVISRTHYRLISTNMTTNEVRARRNNM